ncbi:MAG: glycosyltransferase family 2 protein, partial [Dehalococcoidia bacterium]
YGGFRRQRTEVRNVHGSNMAFRRRAFEAAGLFAGGVGYRRNLVSGEETEFCIRLRQASAGGLIIYEPRAVVYHKVPPSRLTPKYLVQRAYGEGVGKGYISLLYWDRTNTITDEKVYLRHLGRYLGQQVRQALVGGTKPPLMRAGAVALAMVATGLGYWLTVAKGRLRRAPEGATAAPLLEPRAPVPLGGEDG